VKRQLFLGRAYWIPLSPELVKTWLFELNKKPPKIAYRFSATHKRKHKHRKIETKYGEATN